MSLKRRSSIQNNKEWKNYELKWSDMTTDYGMRILYINLLYLKHWHLEKSYHKIAMHSSNT